MELIDGKYVLSDKELAWRKKVIDETFGRRELMAMEMARDEEDQENWDE